MTTTHQGARYGVVLVHTSSSLSLSLSRTFVVKGYNFENILLLLQHYRKKKHDRHGIFPPKSVTPQRALYFFDWKFVFMQETNVICDNSLIFPCIFCSRQTELLSQTWVDGLQESVDEDGRIKTLS